MFSLETAYMQWLTRVEVFACWASRVWTRCASAPVGAESPASWNKTPRNAEKNAEDKMDISNKKEYNSAKTYNSFPRVTHSLGQKKWKLGSQCAGYDRDFGGSKLLSIPRVPTSPLTCLVNPTCANDITILEHPSLYCYSSRYLNISLKEHNWGIHCPYFPFPRGQKAPSDRQDTHRLQSIDFTSQVRNLTTDESDRGHNLANQATDQSCGGVSLLWSQVCCSEFCHLPMEATATTENNDGELIVIFTQSRNGMKNDGQIEPESLLCWQVEWIHIAVQADKLQHDTAVPQAKYNCFDMRTNLNSKYSDSFKCFWLDAVLKIEIFIMLR